MDDKTNLCNFCRTGNLEPGTHDFIARIKQKLIVIKQLPALICNQCGEAYYRDEAMEKIEIVQQQVYDGKFVAHPVAAGEIYASEITK